MIELTDLRAKYGGEHDLEGIDSVEGINDYAHGFYCDVAGVYGFITVQRNPHRNASGFSLSDAPILGLLTRVWKLLRLILGFYEDQNADFQAVFERPLFEASVVATYLLRNGDEAIQDFRMCSYKDTLRILREHSRGSEFFNTKPGQRVLASALNKLAIEGLDQDSFTAQKKNGWRLQGKSVYQIFRETIGSDPYSFGYGMLSESIHGSWANSMDWCLRRNEDQTYSTFSDFHKPDVRTVAPLIHWSTPPYGLWINRIEIEDQDLIEILDWIRKFNYRIYLTFEHLFDG